MMLGYKGWLGIVQNVKGKKWLKIYGPISGVLEDRVLVVSGSIMDRLVQYVNDKS